MRREQIELNPDPEEDTPQERKAKRRDMTLLALAGIGAVGAVGYGAYQAKGLSENLVAETTTRMNQFGTDTSNSVNSFVADTSTAVNNTVHQVEQFSETLPNSLPLETPNPLSSGVEIAENVISQGSSTIGELTGEAISTVQNTAEGLVNGGEEVISDIGNFVRNPLGN